MRRASIATLLLTLLLPATAAAQSPRVVWKEAAAPAFDIAVGADLVDDGTSGDAVAGDGLWSVDLALPADAVDPLAARVLHYALVPPGGDLASPIAAADGTPMVLDLPDGAARTVTIYFGTAADPDEPTTAACPDPAVVLACKGFGPIPGIADSWNLQDSFHVVGDFQTDFGGTAWSPGSALTEVSPTGAASVRLLSPAPQSGLWRIAAPAFRVKLGPGGWDFSGAEATWTGYDLTSDRWQFVRFETRLERGMARAVADTASLFTPLISEVVVDPAAPYVEIHNPAPAPLALGGLLLTDDPGYLLLGGTPAAAGAGDFNVVLPAGPTLAAGGFLTIALGDAAGFQTAYGAAPDLTLSALAPAYAGSVDAAPALVEAGEHVTLYHWLAGDERVGDLDIVVWGAPAAGDEAPDKSGVTVGASTYGTDDMDVNADPAPAGPVMARLDFLESGEDRERSANGVYNGARDTRHDETSEPLGSNWEAAAAATPGAPPTGYTPLVVGRVTASDDGSGVDGAELTATPGGETAVTDSSGFYRTALPAGDHTLTATHVRFYDASTPVSVGGGNVVADLVMDRIPTVTVSGRVEREDGRPIEGAAVHLNERVLVRIYESTTTAADGTFRFERVPQGMLARVTSTAAGFEQATTVFDIADADITGIVLVLPAVPVGFDVTGTVADSVDRTGIPGATVRVDQLGAQATTGPNGTFSLRLIPTGSWTLTAAATDYAPASVQLDVADAAVSGIVVELARDDSALVVRGRITVEGLGIPVAGASVRLTPPGGLTRLEVTDALGDYRFDGVPAGTYAFSVTASGYQTHTQNGIDIRTSTTLDVALTRASGQNFTLSGIVQLADQPQGSWNGSRVEIEGPAPSRENTNGDGEYEVGDLPPGVYRITASHDGYISASLEVGLAADTIQDFILQPEGREPGALDCEGCTSGAGRLPVLALLLALAWLGRRR